MSMIGFPLLLIPLAIVNIIVFLMPGVSFTDTMVSVPLMSKAVWKLTFGDVLIALGMLLLLFEVIKASRPGGKYVTDHLLALVVFAGAAAEFLMLPQFATSVFFLLTVLTLVDFLVGVSLRVRRETPTRQTSVRHVPSAGSSKAPPSSDPELTVADVPAAMPPPMATIEPAHSPQQSAAAQLNATSASSPDEMKR